MRLCRFDDNRVGVIEDDHVCDITEIAQPLLETAWPPPHADALVAALPDLRVLLSDRTRLEGCARRPLSGVTLLSPVARPPKIVAAPVNYHKHVAESVADSGIHHGSAVKDIQTAGLFLKSPTSLIGPDRPVVIRFPERRNDHEIELAVVIGRQADRVGRAEALDYVAGYCIGLDMTVRGPEDRSFRKSPDSYTVLGPWLVTADEFGDPGGVDFWLTVNGETRQRANTRDLIIDVPGLIEFASQWYSLHPGDVLITGTPEGVGPVEPGDRIEAHIDGIGGMVVEVK